MDAAQKAKVRGVFAELLAIVFMGMVSLAAETTGFMLLLFPELAALSHDIMVRPHGKWGSQPLRLVLTPTLTALVGVFVVRHLAFGALGITLIVASSLFIIRALRSTIAAAISAGVLPLALNERSWRYPLALFVDCTTLMLIFLVWKHYVAPIAPEDHSKSKRFKIIDSLEAISHDLCCIPALMIFVVVLGIMAEASNLRFLIFPPLIVMAYELFGHPEVPEWMKRPILFPFVCLLTASVGLLAHQFIHANFIAVMLTFLLSVGILHVFDLRMPPALAVGLLPFVIQAPDYRFPLSVLIGTISLGLYFSAYKKFRQVYMQQKPVVETLQ